MRRLLRIHSPKLHAARECWCQDYVNRWWYGVPRRHSKEELSRHAYAHLSPIGRLRIAWRLIRHNSTP